MLHTIYSKISAFSVLENFILSYSPQYSEDGYEKKLRKKVGFFLETAPRYILIKLGFRRYLSAHINIIYPHSTLS